MIQIGQKSPDFCCSALINGQIKDAMSWSDFEGKYKVLFFYPLDFTFVCPTELHAFQEKVEEFKKRNTAVIGCSIDSVHTHLAWWQTPKLKGGISGITYPILSDVTKKIAQSFGVLDEEQGVALRGVFILDQQNVVQSMIVNNLSLGRNVDEILRLIDAVQYAEKNGQVCPANWQPGKKAMKPDQEGLYTYFQETGSTTEQQI